MLNQNTLSMLKRTTGTVGLLAGLAMGMAGVAHAQSNSGTLSRGDAQLQSGEYVDSYTFNVAAGQQISVDLTSNDFDTYLIVKPPQGEQIDNDDWEGSLSHSRVETVATTGGTYEVLVTSFAIGETGSYSLNFNTGGYSAPSGGYSFAGPAITGTLANGDETLSSGEYIDTFDLGANAGDTVTIDLTATDFDPYLLVIAPDGSQLENDDWEGSLTHSRIETIAPVSGTYSVGVTSFAAGETGNYSLVYDTGAGGFQTSTGGSTPLANTSGSLAPGDQQLQSGEYQDSYFFTAQPGQSIVVDLTSDQFDPYLILKPPQGEQLDNDDWEGSLSQSRIETTATSAGEYEVVVTSFAVGETGSYNLQYGVEGGSGYSGYPNQNAGGFGSARSESGTLARGDEQLDDGEFYDSYTFSGQAGQRMSIEMASNEFDTWVGLIGDDGVIDANDDAPNMGTNSLLELNLPYTGDYTVIATSYAPGETGAYTLNIGGSSSAPTTTRPTAPISSTNQLQVGSSVTANLSSEDRTLSGGEYADIYTFTAEAGQPIRVEMNSGPIDTYLVVSGPAGFVEENDDFEGSLDNSVVEFRAPATGTYSITATSYDAGETGNYTLSVLDEAGAQPTTRYNNNSAGGTEVFGIFVGISDYPSFYNDLPYTAQDAVLARDAVRDYGSMNAQNSILLTDSQATMAGLQQAFAQISQRMDEDDTLVFFFSGHGSRQDRASGPDDADLDGIDETLVLYDQDITDDQLNALFDTMPSARTLIILDSCYSGGFAKDVISAPGRMGLFSSEEDVISLVAQKFEAGGYLAHFFNAALETGDADLNGDMQVDAIELSQYLRTSYMLEHNESKRPLQQFDSLDDIDVTYQHLVVDRSGVSPYEVFFDLSR